MDRFSKRQEKIDQYRNQALIRYPALWSNMIAEWKMPDPKDLVWLMYSANYLFRTNDVRWAIDPLTMSWRVKAAPLVDGARDLTGLDFVLLTHEHEDHLDLELLSALRHRPIRWVVPEFMLSRVVGQAGLPREKIMVPSASRSMELNGIRILPFDGLHWESIPDGAKKGISSVGYLVECNDKRWLFPGDTRSYNSDPLPDFKTVDVVFAHLWLGRGSALMDEPRSWMLSAVSFWD